MPDRGFVFATTGPDYTNLAQQAARTLHKHCPDIPIDLFTDIQIDDKIFSRIHLLEKSGHRPKMEALYRSRFERTVYLDADLIIVADISDIFDMLGRFDLAAAHDQFRNHKSATVSFHRPLPAAFPQYNAGVIGLLASTETHAFLRAWEKVVLEEKATRDQPAFRELLFDSALHICTLPAEYNVHRLEHVRSWTSEDCAPRILHHYWLHQHITFGWPRINSKNQLLGTRLSGQMNKLVEADKYLSPDNTIGKVSAFCDRYPGKRIPPSRRIQGWEGIRHKLSHPFRGTRGAQWFNSVNNWINTRQK